MGVLPLILPLLTAVVGSVFSWLFFRRKHNHEANLLQMQEIEKSFSIWKSLTEELRRELTTMQSIKNQIIADNEALRIKIIELESLLESIKAENKKLIQHIEKIKREYAASHRNA